MMTAEELMRPRFRVINPYPNMVEDNFFVGDILTFSEYDEHLSEYFNYKRKNKVYACFYEAYPLLFKKLDWWEDREKWQMPRKLVFISDRKQVVHNIIDWDMDNFNGIIKYGSPDKVCSLTNWGPNYGYIPVD